MEVMKAKTELKQKAIDLRRRGWSYKEIKQQIRVAKSTLSLWLKGIRLSDKHRERLYTKRINYLSKGPQSQKERRRREVEAIIEQSKKEIKYPMSRQAYLLFGAALYWAEGSKGSAIEITNSDPYLIYFMVEWCENVFGISRKKFSGALNMYSQQNESELRKFWSELTGVPLNRFCKSYVKPPNKGYKKNNLYYGTIKVRVPSSADLKHKVYGWVQGALGPVPLMVQKHSKKWQRLKNVNRPVNLS